MIVGYAGSREFPELERVKESVLALDVDDIVVSGGARGVDRMAEKTASESGLRVISFRPYNAADGTRFPWRIHRWLYDPESGWTQSCLPEQYGGFAAAAHVRNTYIVETAEHLNLFWDGSSRGTKDTLRKAEAARLPHDLIRVVPTNRGFHG